jgi:Domain of unknown function (DU1801)
MAENKTKPTTASVSDFLAALEPERRRNDAHEIESMMAAATGKPAELWGSAIVGYGRTHDPEWFVIGFSPRKANLVLYGVAGEDNDKLLARLGRHKRGVGCLYITKLDDIDRAVLRKLITQTAASPRTSRARGGG